MVQNLDDNIGRLLAHLDKRNLANDTIVMFLCDNGPQTDRYNVGLRARKGSVYEGGTRSPLYVRYPAKLKGGRQVDRLAAHIDLTPTLLDLCGVNRPAGPALDGVSLKPLLESASASWPERMIYTHADHQPDPTKPYPGCARTQRYKMVNGNELYDLVSDPGERNNLAQSLPKELSNLVSHYEAWFASTLEGFTPGAPPIPVGYRQENPATLTAPQATLAGGLKYFMRQGFAHDFATGWSGEADSMTWRVSPQQAGRYEIQAEYRAPQPGSRLSLNGAPPRETTQAVPMEEIHLPHRAHNGNEAPVVSWAHVSLGPVDLPAAESKLQLKVSQVPADIKSLKVRLL
jgi:arylsulfatase A